MEPAKPTLFWRRRLTRIAALGLVVLVVIHVVGLWLGGESPVLFNTMFYVRIRSGMALETALSDTTSGAMFAVLTLLLAWLLWSQASLVAALLLVPVTLWEFYHRFWQLSFVLSEGFSVGIPMVLGCVSASLAVVITLFALIGAVTRV